jgi:hypothetical protein
MRKLALLGAATAVALAAAPGIASERRATIPSEIDVLGFSTSPAADGRILTPRPACLANRRVRIFARTASGPVLISTDRSSDNGFWGGAGPAEDVDGVRAVLKPKRLGPGRRCGGSIDEVSVPRAPATRLGGTTYPTDVHLGTSALGDNPFVTGSLTTRKKCRANRKIRINAIIDDESFLIDTDRSSDNGYFGGGGSAPGANGIRVNAPAKRLGPGRRCGAGSAATIIN